LATDDHGFARIVRAEPTGDVVLDGLLTEMTVHRRSWKAWLRHHLQAEVASVLAGEPAASAADPGLAALGLLAAAGVVRPVLRTRTSRGGHIAELAARLDTAASPLGQRIRGLRMVMIAAQGGMGGS
jgi:hypothetical protein